MYLPPFDLEEYMPSRVRLMLDFQSFLGVIKYEQLENR